MTVTQLQPKTHLPYQAVKVTDHVYWVGAIDWKLRDFHGYATERGTTYNAFLVLGEKVALIDTVKAPFKEEMLARIASVLPVNQIDYLISNHAEMDHSGCLPEMIALAQPEKIFASAFGVKGLVDHFHLDQEIVTVKDGDTLSLGNLTLAFLETRMLHWPDSMFTFLAEEGVLFSNDAFGMHLATSARFADELPTHLLDDEAGKYFANILLPYSHLVAKLLAKLPSLNWHVNIIAPDHGPIWRDNLAFILNRYGTWAEGRPGNTALVVYDTMWDSTARMARAIAEGLAAGGAAVEVLPLSANQRSDVAAKLLHAGALLIGSPTLNNNLFPTVADALTYLRGLKPRNLVGAAFGSYGWSGEAVAQIHETLTAMKVETVCEGLKAKYVPTTEALEACAALGRDVATRITVR